MAITELEVLWEDEAMMVVNKPAFLVVNRAESITGMTVADWADERFSIQSMKLDPSVRLEKTFLMRSGVAHRLDKETSGCLLLAKSPEALGMLLGQFHDRVVKKEYLALVHGRMGISEGVVKLPLARSRYDREKWEIRYDGKVAETAWKVESRYRKVIRDGGMAEDFSLVRCFPKTGRTHQIRVHLAHMGYPIFADEKYLTRSKVADDRKLLSHHFLHAEKIGFKDISGVFREVVAPLPSDELKLLRWMESE